MFSVILNPGKKNAIEHVELMHPDWIQSFLNKQALLKHILMESSSKNQEVEETLEQKKIFRCDICGIGFSRNYRLTKHITDGICTRQKSTGGAHFLTPLTNILGEDDIEKMEMEIKRETNTDSVPSWHITKQKQTELDEDGNKKIIPRVRLSLQEKAKLIEESKRPGFNRKEVIARYGINPNTIVNILKKQDEILEMIHSGMGHKTNTNYGKERPNNYGKGRPPKNKNPEMMPAETGMEIVNKTVD